MHERNCKNWATNEKKLLYSLGLNYYWDQQELIDCNSFLYDFDGLRQRIRDQYIHFFNDISTFNRLNKYCIIKSEFKFEEYLKILNGKLRILMSKFKCISHKLMIEHVQGRYMNIDRNMRICKNCNSGIVEDEYHFLLACPAYRDFRQKYFKKFFYTWPSSNKFKILMTTKSTNVNIL